MTSGDIFFTPPAYVCDIQKTFSAEHEAAYKAKENIPFRKTLDGLVVKSQLSCDQADALCTVNKFFEKVRVGITLDKSHFRWLKVYLCRDRDDSSNRNLDSVTFNHLN